MGSHDLLHRFHIYFFFNPAAGVTDLEGVKGAALGVAECTFVLYILNVTVQLLHDQPELQCAISVQYGGHQSEA